MMSHEKTPHESGAVRALVVSHLYPSTGDPVLGIFVHEQVKALRASGVDARVVSFYPMHISSKNPIRSLYAVYWTWSRRKAGTWVAYEGVPVTYVPYWIFPWGGDVSNALSLLWSLALNKKRIRRTFPFQLIHAHTAMLGGTGAQLLKFGSRIPVVLTEHTGPFHRLTDTPGKMFLTSHAILRADKVFAVSDSLGQTIISHVPGAVVETVSNGTDTDRFSLCSQPAEDGHITMLWVGGADPIKRSDRLIEAFGIAIRKEPRLRLIAVGANAFVDQIYADADRHQVREAISFVPCKHPRDMPALYQRCDFLVVSSDAETFGVAVIEAMSCGKPVLSTACGGPEEIICDTEFGMVTHKNAEALAEGMVAMSSKLTAFDPVVIRRHVTENFDISKISSALADIYVDILSSRQEREPAPRWAIEQEIQD